MHWHHSLAFAPALIAYLMGSVGEAQPSQGPPQVETTLVERTELGLPPIYTGTTNPAQQATLRAQVEGQILELAVDVGDSVTEGQILARQDDRLLQTSLSEAEATLAAIEAELAESEANISRAQSALAQAELNYQQALNDAARLQELANEGAIARQTAEQAETQAAANAQVVIAAEAQVRAETQVLAARQQRRTAQLAVIQRAEQNLAFTTLVAPFAGIITTRAAEMGTLIRPGETVLSLGQFDPLEITVPISELEISRIQLGQIVSVRLDASDTVNMNGEIIRIAPQADPDSRQIPVTVQLANPGSRLGGGLLARVTFANTSAATLIVPESAVRDDRVFILNRDTAPPTVQAQTVELGERQDGRVQVLSGLAEGNEIVVRSSQPLETGMSVEASEPAQANRSLR